jgi:short subunit dehydrogenase-like uncharacterized protein
MKGAFSGGTASSLNATEDAISENDSLRAVMNNPFCLANGFRGPDLPGGFYTPGPAMGERLMQRLVDRTGFTFALEDGA